MLRVQLPAWVRYDVTQLLKVVQEKTGTNNLHPVICVSHFTTFSQNGGDDDEVICLGLRSANRALKDICRTIVTGSKENNTTNGI